MHLSVVLLLLSVSQAPERVAPDVLATPRNETFPAIDPVTGDLWFSVYDRNFDAQTLMVARRSGASWAAPEVASLSGTHGDRAPRFSVNGRLLFFSSNRPIEGYPPRSYNVWVVERTGSAWGTPRPADALNNPTGASRHNSVTADGIHYVSSTRPGGFGRSDIWRVGPGGAVANLGSPINTDLSQPDLWVSPDGSWMILVITDHPDGLGGDDLFISEFTNGRWTTPRHLPAPINSDEYEYGPWVHADWLYFTSHRGGHADIWRVRLSTVRP